MCIKEQKSIRIESIIRKRKGQIVDIPDKK